MNLHNFDSYKMNLSDGDLLSLATGYFKEGEKGVFNSIYGFL